MKKLLFLSIASAMFGFSACKKINGNSDGTSPIYTPPAGGGGTTVDPLAEVGSLPIDYTKKAVLEEFTGEWCGWCPEGGAEMEAILSANPGRVVGIGVHDKDPMELPSFNSWIQTLTGVSGFPNGSVSRQAASGRGSWAGEVTSQLAKVATTGLAIVSKKNGNNYDIKVFIGYQASQTSDIKLTVAITEDKVPQSSPGAQSNYSSSVVVDANWTHSHVLRGFVTDEKGNDVDLTSNKKYTIVEFKDVDLSTMNIKDINKVSVAAFLNKNTDTRDILNAQEVKLGSTKKWD